MWYIMKDNLYNIGDAKLFIQSLGKIGEQAGGKETLVFCTPQSTAVWVNENSKEGIYQGISKNEYYDTSGPFIRIRFFGGWDFPPNMTKDPDFIKKAYAEGVPMGGRLKSKPENIKAPTFAVWALKDPNSVNRERRQSIKGWSINGLTQEKVYDVAGSDSRESDPTTGKLPPIDHTTLLKDAKDRKNIGDSQLSAVWRDPDFDPSQYAVYYARVIEISSPRRVEYDAKEPWAVSPEIVHDSIQGRAWTSPISYSPNEKSQ